MRIVTKSQRVKVASLRWENGERKWFWVHARKLVILAATERAKTVM